MFHSRRKLSARLIDACLFGLFLALVYNLRERFIDYALEPDFRPEMISSWRQFLGTGQLAALPVPTPVPYLDGQYILYALAAKLLRASVLVVPAWSAWFPSQDAYNISAALLVDSVAYAAACWLFYRMMLRLTGSMPLATGLALTLCISPPMLDINLVRLDYLIMLPVIVLFSGGLTLARRKETILDAVTLGAALAFVSTFKLTGGVFGIFIAIGLIVRFRFGPLSIRRQHILCFAGSFLFLFIPLMFRYWAYLPMPEIAAVLWGGVGSVAHWDFFDQPLSYYAVTLFMAHGLDFVILYLAASAFVVGLAVIRRDETSLYLAIAFLLFSALGLVVMRYERGGYHLLPLYLANVGLTITTLWRIAPPRLLPKAVAAIAAAVLAISLVPAGIHYLQVVHDMKARAAAVDETLGASLEWLRTHVAAGSRVCIYKDSYWSGPPISRLPVTLVDTAFDFPYLDKVEMANFAVPSLATLRSECEVVVLSGFYTGFIDHVLRIEAPEQAARWRHLVEEMRAAYPPAIFQHQPPISFAYSVTRLEVFDLR
jgi:hypothetical protein